MRYADRKKAWSTLLARPYRTKVGRVGYENVRSLGTGTLNFAGPLTVVCGGNGVGKSTLLDVVYIALGGSGDERTLERLYGARLSCAFANANVDGTHERPFVDNPLETSFVVPCARIDSARESRRVFEILRSSGNFDELLEAYDPAIETDDDRKTLSYLVGREYSECKTYELEEIDGVATPYFRVRCGTAEYGAETMGQGELALFLFYWHLRRVPEGSVLLLEEPDAHISAASQAALMDVLAREASRRGLWTVVTTHSPRVVQMVPRQNTLLVVRHGGDVRIISNPDDPQLQTTLGFQQHQTLMVLVEDQVAKLFAETWLQSQAPHLRHMVEVVICPGGASDVKEALRFPKAAGVRMCGLLDGDQRNATEADARRQWPVGFLPGDRSFELLAKDACRRASAVLSGSLNLPHDRIVTVLASIDGMDHHDWLRELCRETLVAFERMVPALFETWLSTDDGQTAAATAMREFEALFAT